MSPLRARRCAVTAFIILLAASTNSAQAFTRHVPSAQFPTIQKAVLWSQIGDTVRVDPGTYEERIDTLGKYLFILGSGSSSTIIDGGGVGRCVTLSGGGELSGFTLRNGKADVFGGGVAVSGPNDATIRAIKITSCIVGPFDVGSGGGLYIDCSTKNVLVEGSVFERNDAGYAGGGIYNCGAYTIIRDNTFLENTCYAAGGGLFAGSSYVYRNVFARNHCEALGGGIYGGGIEIYDNTLVGNSHNNPLQQGAGIHIGDGEPLIHNNIVVGSHGPQGHDTGVGIKCLGGFTHPIVRCNDSWNNTGPDYFLDCPGQEDSNVSLDPLFCNRGPDDYALAGNSPCSGLSKCGLIGALAVACADMPSRSVTWGRIKAMLWKANRP